MDKFEDIYLIEKILDEAPIGEIKDLCHSNKFLNDSCNKISKERLFNFGIKTKPINKPNISWLNIYLIVIDPYTIKLELDEIEDFINEKMLIRDKIKENDPDWELKWSNYFNNVDNLMKDLINENINNYLDYGDFVLLQFTSDKAKEKIQGFFTEW